MITTIHTCDRCEKPTSWLGHKLRVWQISWIGLREIELCDDCWYLFASFMHVPKAK